MGYPSRFIQITEPLIILCILVPSSGLGMAYIWVFYFLKYGLCMCSNPFCILVNISYLYFRASKMTGIMTLPNRFQVKTNFLGRATGVQSQVGSKFPNLKILSFLLLPQNFTTNQGLHSNFPHPVPRTACQCPYAKEMR